MKTHYAKFTDVPLRRIIYTETVGSYVYDYVCEALPSVALSESYRRIFRNKYSIDRDTY